MTGNGTELAVARALLAAGAVRVQPDAPVTFKSGLRSPVYVDNRRLIFVPASWRVVIGALAARVEAAEPPVEVVAGVESAGIPHSSALAYAARLPSVFVRKEAKGHGLGRRVEGGDVSGRRTLLVEDMVAAGGDRPLAGGGGARGQQPRSILPGRRCTYGFAAGRQAFAEAPCTWRSVTPSRPVWLRTVPPSS